MAAAVKPVETDLQTAFTIKCLIAKACNCLQMAARVFDPDQKNHVRHALNGSMKKSDRGASPWVRKIIEAADRKIHDGLLHQHLSHWHPISTAPTNHDLELMVLDQATAAVLPFPCKQTNAGEWINADLGTSIHIQPIKWRSWQKPKP